MGKQIPERKGNSFKTFHLTIFGQRFRILNLGYGLGMLLHIFKKRKKTKPWGRSQESNHSKIPVTQTLVEMTLRHSKAGVTMCQERRNSLVWFAEQPTLSSTVVFLIFTIQNHAGHNYIHQMFRSILILSADLRSSWGDCKDLRNECTDFSPFEH